MDTADRSARQGHRLLQLGIVLFLLALLVGLVVPTVAVPRLALSTHLLGIMQGLFLMVLGLLWPKLRIARVMSRLGFFLVVYACLAAWLANLFAAIWGAGSSMMPIAAGQAHGTPLQEGVIAIALMSAAASLISALFLILWGLRTSPRP